MTSFFLNLTSLAILSLIIISRTGEASDQIVVTVHPCSIDCDRTPEQRNQCCRAHGYHGSNGCNENGIMECIRLNSDSNSSNRDCDTRKKLVELQE